MNHDKITKLANYFRRVASVDIFLFAFVPKHALPSIRKKGLLSAIELIKDTASLKAAKPKDWKSFKKSIEDKLKDPEWKEILNGISVFFTLPDWEKLPDKHFIFKNDLVPIKINLTKFIKDNPKTKLLGVELSPRLIESRERYLTFKEVKEYTEQSPKKLWKHYKGQTDKYAPDVPHLVIIASNILPKYLDI